MHHANGAKKGLLTSVPPLGEDVESTTLLPWQKFKS